MVLILVSDDYQDDYIMRLMISVFLPLVALLIVGSIILLVMRRMHRKQMAVLAQRDPRTFGHLISTPAGDSTLGVYLLYQYSLVLHIPIVALTKIHPSTMLGLCTSTPSDSCTQSSLVNYTSCSILF